MKATATGRRGSGTGGLQLHVGSKSQPTQSNSNDRVARRRGVFEDLDAFPDTRAFLVRDAAGTRIFHCTLPSNVPETTLEFLYTFLETWLEEAAPPPRLRRQK